jgi:hypothetical protein
MVVLQFSAIEEEPEDCKLRVAFLDVGFDFGDFLARCKVGCQILFEVRAPDRQFNALTLEVFFQAVFVTILLGETHRLVETENRHIVLMSFLLDQIEGVYLECRK